MKSLTLVLSVLVASSLQAAPKKKGGSKTANGLTVTLWAQNPLVASPLGIAMDPQGRAYVTRVRRRKISSLDIRRHGAWVKHDLSIQSLDDRLDFYKKAVGPGVDPSIKAWSPPDRNGDGKRDWRDLAVQKEEVYCVIDTNGDGVADKKIDVHATATPVTGIAAGALFADGAAYSAIEPDIWRYDDSNGDGIMDKATRISTGYSIHIGQGGHNMSGMAMGMDGRIYWSVGDKGINATGTDGARVILPNRGAVMRCEPDGSKLEVFNYGVRNAQELAFDEYGNMFSVDNDGDYRGERERFLYIIEGAQTGWRLNWQWFRFQDFAKVSGEKPYNVWMEEKLFKTRFKGQAAWIVPPVANYSNGPCGFSYNPGTALTEQYHRYFFLAQGKKLSAFQVKSKGASFEMTNEHTVHSGIYNTGIDFGPDGALYICDWMNGPSNNGRIYKLDGTANEVRKQTQAILKVGFKKSTPAELSAFLKHPDMRVRRGAQFALTRHGAAGAATLLTAANSSDVLLARLHGIWGAGQLGRKDPRAMAALMPLLKNKDPEVRAQTAKVMGEAFYKPAAKAMISLLNDKSIRVRFHAATAIGKLEDSKAFDPIIKLIQQNNDVDAYLRHATMMGLLGSAKATPDKLTALAKHPSPAVRLVALLALRRLLHEGTAAFLKDKDLYIVAEAARAIHDDFSIPAALPALAEVLDRKDLAGEPLLRRAINANFRVGRPADAQRLARYAARTDAPEKMRTTALACLALWPQPPVLDAVEGRYRAYAPRDPGPAAAALASVAQKLVTAPAKVQTVLARAAQRLKTSELLPVVHAMYDSKNANGKLRTQLLATMYDLGDPKLAQYAKLALKDSDKKLSAAAQKYAAATGVSAIDLAKKSLASDSIPSVRAALDNLGRSADPKADALLLEQMGLLASGKLNPAVELDLLEAAARRKGPAIAASLKTYEGKLAAKGKVGPFLTTRAGGDTAAGRKVAFGHPAAQCIRCHKINGTGSDVGPDLSKIAGRLPQDKMLEALIDPGATLAEGFGMLVATTKDDKTVSGTVVSKTASAYTLKGADGKTFQLARNAIKTETLASPMPPMGLILQKREIRDLLEFLSTLK
jgi:quinoprotein glucose dehydrogenase